MLAARHLVPALAALLAPLSTAAAQESRDCATLRLLADPGADLSRLGLTFGRDGTMALTVSGRSDIVAGAQECEFSGPAESFSANCEWSANSLATALSRFNFMRDTLQSCIATEFELRENTYSQDGYSVLRQFAGSIEEEDEDDYRVIDIALYLVQYDSAGFETEFWVQLDFSR